MPYISESETPSSFDISYDGALPQRELTDFVVTRGRDHVSICALDDRKAGDSEFIARGTLVDRSRNTIQIETDPLIDWCIEYGTSPNLWIRTRKTWYQLKKPAKEYSKTHESARRRFELCSRIYILATSMEKHTCTYALFTSLLSSPYLRMKGYTEKELLLEKQFILAQIKNLSDPQLSDIPFVRELSEMKGVSKKPSSKKKQSSSSASMNGLIVASAIPGLSDKWQPSGSLDKDGNARLLKRAEKAVNQIYKNKNAWPFREPVDPIKHNIPNYFDIIKRPMDYGTIKKNLEKGSYSNVIDVVTDMRQVVKNCCDFNSASHSYSVWAIELQRKFESMMKSGEEAEIVAMKSKEVSRKRKSTDSVSTSASKVAKKGSKVSRKSSSKIVSSSPAASSPEQQRSSTAKLCARSKNNLCENFQTPGSKYCSDDCGFQVAAERIAELTKSGFSVDEYISAGITKLLVHSRF